MASIPLSFLFALELALVQSAVPWLLQEAPFRKTGSLCTGRDTSCRLFFDFCGLSGNDRYRSQLLKNVRKHHWEMVVSESLVSRILYNYACMLDLCGSYREAARTTLECKKACIDTGHLSVSPQLSGNLQRMLHFLGHDAESAEAYTQAYHLCNVTSLQDDLEIVKTEAYQSVYLPATDHAQIRSLMESCIT